VTPLTRISAIVEQVELAGEIGRSRWDEDRYPSSPYRLVIVILLDPFTTTKNRRRAGRAEQLGALG
jgi:hypothetical protein